MASKRIVIVDDEPNIGRSLQLILDREGYAASICHSAAEFRKTQMNSRADAYLIDVRLPDGNGIDLLRLLRQSDNRAPVIMISGHGTIGMLSKPLVAARSIFWKSRWDATGFSSS